MINHPPALEGSILQAFYHHESDRQGALAGWDVAVSLRKREQRLFSLPLVAVKGLPKGKGEEPRLQAVALDLKEQSFYVINHSRETLPLAPPAPMTEADLYLNPTLLFMSTEQLQQVITELTEAAVDGAPLLRTQSVQGTSPSPAWHAQIREWILNHYGAAYLSAKAHPLKPRKPQEVILYPDRPLLTPKKLKKKLNQASWSVYTAIWERCIASQMAPARVERMTLEVSAGEPRRYLFRRIGEEILSRGFMQALPLQRQGRSTAFYHAETALLQTGESLELVEVRVEKKTATDFFAAGDAFFQVWRGGQSIPPAQLRTALLKLSMAEYLESSDKGWRLSDRGRCHAAQMVASPSTPGPTPENSCPQCGAALMLRNGPYGSFYGCSAYPKCRYTTALTLKVSCPMESCAGQVVERQSKTGKRFYGCSRYPDCTFMSWNKPTAILCFACQSQTLVEKLDEQGQVHLYCGSCGRTFNRKAIDLNNQSA